MKKITEESVRAFNGATPFKKSSTEIEVLPNVTVMRLHGNPIAYRYNDPERTLSVTNCGWFSRVTMRRLNALDGVDIRQVRGKWYLNGKEWDGGLVDIKKL